MNTAFKVRKIGNSVGILLGKETLSELGVAEGDILYAVRVPGGIQLTPFDPDFAEALDAARDFMSSHRDALRELAK